MNNGIIYDLHKVLLYVYKYCPEVLENITNDLYNEISKITNIDLFSFIDGNDMHFEIVASPKSIDVTFNTLDNLIRGVFSNHIFSLYCNDDYTTILNRFGNYDTFKSGISAEALYNISRLTITVLNLSSDHDKICLRINLNN